jgi:serine kinase of HPr protein (carbohydrate metabolism regulator)
MKRKTVHGTCVALGTAGALLRGSCGSGKSDLALRFLYLPSDRLGADPALVADDQVILRRDGDRVLASCPQALCGKIEVRGFGIAHLKAQRCEAELKLVVDLDWTGDRPRFPEETEWETVLDVPIRRVILDPFELSAPIKLALAIQDRFGEAVD